MPESVLSGQGATLLTAIIIVAIALLALVGVFWLIRNRAASTFIRGGKNRQPRLAVLDATAVDTRRRLVLIRRDDVEHLVMIGGPTDIVIESGIPQTGQAGQVHSARHADLPMQAPPQQRAAPAPSAQPVAPQRQRTPSAASPQPAPAAPQHSPRKPETAARPSPRQQQTPQAAAPAATAATAGAATTISTEAADLLETARNRVFEEPEFDANDLEELIANSQPAPSQQATSASAPASTLASQNQNQPPADPIQTQAADVLETVRTRIFEEPTFDENAFDELTADTASSDQGRAEPALRSPLQPPQPASPSPTPAPSPATTAPSSDFESVLAAELSDDPALGSPRDNFLAAHYSEHQLSDDEDDRQETPEVKPEPQQPSRDSLEAEMEKLLGDLSRKS